MALWSICVFYIVFGLDECYVKYIHIYLWYLWIHYNQQQQDCQCDIAFIEQFNKQKVILDTKGILSIIFLFLDRKWK